MVERLERAGFSVSAVLGDYGTHYNLRAVVATSSLDLGIDWGDIDLVIQVGAPKGVSRLLQRVGRANHRMDETSRALLVPAHQLIERGLIAALRQRRPRATAKKRQGVDEVVH